jgi:hypothetical protein
VKPRSSVWPWVAGATACAAVVWWIGSEPESAAVTAAQSPGTAQVSSTSGVAAQSTVAPANGETRPLASAAVNASDQIVQVREGTPPPPLPPEPPQASQQQQAAADALVRSSFETADVAGAQPRPVDLRRDKRHVSRNPVATELPVSAVEVGLPSYPGATAMQEQSGRQGKMVTMTLLAKDSLGSVRAFYAAQLHSSADFSRQVTVLRDDGSAYDARVVDLNDRSVQRVRLAATGDGAVLQLSRVDVQ